MTPKLYNKKLSYPDDCVSIMRGTPYGNPYVVGRHGTREECVELFIQNALPLMNLEPLRGHNLLCCCVPLLCHGAPIMRKLYG